MKTFGKIWLGIGLVSFALGICLLIIAFAAGFGWRKANTYSFEEKYEENINALDFKMEYGLIKIVEGEEFSIAADGLFEDGHFESVVKNGVWTIREESTSKFKLFKLNLPTVTVFGERFEPDIVITLPRGFKAEDIKLDMGAVRLEAESLSAESGSIAVGAGEARIRQLEIAKKASFDVGAGYMELGNAKLNNITADCGIGYLQLKGIVTGMNRLECGVGKIRMDLEGDVDAYSYEVETGIGNVRINGKNYFGSVDRNARKDALGSFDLECGIGNITLEIYE
jgi:hypothetical protein